MNYKIKKIKEFPEDQKYLWYLLDDAEWLITTELEKRGFFRGGDKIIPRDIILRIRLLPSKKKLPLVLNRQISFGKAYDPKYTLEYSSGAFEAGTPSMYFNDPDEYWAMRDDTSYLTKKQIKKKTKNTYKSVQNIPVPPRDRKV